MVNTREEDIINELSNRKTMNLLSKSSLDKFSSPVSRNSILCVPFFLHVFGVR